MMFRRYGTVAVGLILSEANVGGCITASRLATIPDRLGERILSRNARRGTSCHATEDGASTTAQASRGSMEGAASAGAGKSPMHKRSNPNHKLKIVPSA